MADMKSSKDVAKQATNNLDPNIAKIAQTTDAIASTLSQQSSAIQQLKESISRFESGSEDANKKIASSLQMSNKHIGVINRNLSEINKNISSMTSVVSNMSTNGSTTISLLGGIQTSLIQITSVLSAFRADYLLANSGGNLKGDGYYDINLLANVANNLRSIRDPNIQKQLNAMIKAANYANKASNSVRGKLGNSNMAKDSDENGILDKILGLAQQGQQYAGLAALLPGKVGKLGQKVVGANTSSVADLIGSFMSSDQKKKILNPLKEMGMDFTNSDNPLKQMLGGFMDKIGLSKSKKEREKDPNLVMSSLAPFADDIKDMVELAYKGVKKRPKTIPIYATPVWVVNSSEQVDHVNKSGGTHGKDLEENRLRELLEGVANNTKDKYGRDLLSQDEDGKYHGVAKKGFGQDAIKQMAQQANQKIHQINHESLNENGAITGTLNSVSNALDSDLAQTLGPMAGSLVSGLFGSHKGGKKGRLPYPSEIKGSHKDGKVGDLNRDEQTKEHQVATIDQSTTILNESQNKKAKTNKDVLSGQITVAAGLSSLIDIFSQENILLSQAVNDGKIDLREAKGYPSSFDGLEKIADKAGADNNAKKAITQFKKASDLSKILKKPKKKTMTTSEYFGREDEEAAANEEKVKSLDDLKNKLKDKLIGGVMDKFDAKDKVDKLKDKFLKKGIGNKIQAGINTSEKLGKKIGDKALDKIKNKFGLSKKTKKDDEKGLLDKGLEFSKKKLEKLKDSKLGKKTAELGDKTKDEAKSALKSIGSKLKDSKTLDKLKNSNVGKKVSGALDEVKKTYSEELKKVTEDGAKEAADAAKVAADKQKAVMEESAAEAAHNAEMRAADSAAAAQRNAAKEANDKVQMATENAADKSEMVAEQVQQKAELAQKTAASEAEVAVNTAASEGGVLLKLKTMLSNVATKVCGLPLPAKIALGAAGIAAVGVIGAKIMSKIKKAAKGKKGGGGDDGGNSAKGASKDQQKEAKKAEKERKKQEKKEKREKFKAKAKRALKSHFNRLTGGLFATKVYVAENGDVLKSKGDEPIKKLDEDGNETDETLNIKDKDGKKQFLKRLLKREFKMDKAKALKGALKKIGGKLKGAAGKLKDKFKEAKERAKNKLKKKSRSALNFLTGGLTAAKVYVDKNGDVLYSKDNTPVKMLDKFGNETDETLNVKNLKGKIQFVTRLAKREFKVDKLKAIKGVLKKAGKNIKANAIGTKDKIKDILGKIKDKANNTANSVKNGIIESTENVKEGAKGLFGKTKRFFKKHDSTIGSFVLSGPLGLSAYGVGKIAGKSIFGFAKKALGGLKEKAAAKLNQLLLMSSSAYLFMDDKLQKQLDGIENSDFGKQMIDNPVKAASTIFNVAAGGVATLLSKAKSGIKALSNAKNNVSGSLKSLLNKLTNRIMGKDDTNKKYTSNLEDIDEESATMAFAKLNENNNRNEIMNAFSKSLGLTTTKSGDNGRIMTKSQILNEERKKKAVRLGIVGEGATTSSATAIGSGGIGGTLQTAIPYATYATWKQGWPSRDGQPHWTNKGWNTKTAISIGGADLGSSGCSLCSNALMLVHYGIVQDPSFNPGIFADDVNSRPECAGGCGGDAPMRHMCEYKGSKQVTYHGHHSLNSSNWDDVFNTIVKKMQEGYIVIGHVSNHYCGPVDYVDLANKVIYFLDPGFRANCWYDRKNPSPSLQNPSADYTKDGDDAGYTSSSGPSGKSFHGIVLYKADGVDPSVYLLNGRRNFDSLHETGNAPNATVFPGANTASGEVSNVAVAGKTAKDYLAEALGATISRGVMAGHRGIDFVAAAGTKIYTPVGGKVVACANDADRIICTNNNGANQDNGGMGNFVIVKTDDGKYATFMHMREAPAVKTGDVLVPGQFIGLVGNTGDSYGAHLHYEMKTGMWNGNVIDPATYPLTGKGKYTIEDEPKNKNKKVFGGEKQWIEDEPSKAKVSTPEHLYQRDYSNILFNKNGDSELQTLGDSGCGPAAATMVKRLYGNGKKYIPRYKRNKGIYGRAEEEKDTKTIKGDELKTTEDSKNISTAKVSTSNDPQSVLGQTASYTNDVGDTYTVTIEQEHIDIFNKCREAGCSDAAACGVLGNLHQETGGTGEKLRYWACNHGTYGGGIMQWTPWSKHVDWANAHNMSPWTWEASIAHMQDELVNGGNWNNPNNASPSLASKGYTAYANTAEWMATNDPASAAVNFERAFEVSGDWNGKNSEGVHYSENMIYDRKRVGPAVAYYNCFKGLGSSSATPSSSATVSGNVGLVGWINLITDSAVDGSSLANYSTGNSIWNNSSNTTTNSSNSSSGSGRTGRGNSKNKLCCCGDAKKSNSNNKIFGGAKTLRRKFKNIKKNLYGKGIDGISFANTHFVAPGEDSSNETLSSNNTPTVTPSTDYNTPKKSSITSSIDPYISNTMSVTDTDENGNSTTTTNVYTDNNKTTLTTTGKSTVVICNNFTEKNKTDLTDIISSFKHLNGTQNNALKVLKAISDLIKEENPEALAEAAKLRLSNEGLDFILKGL
jgi:murein DD-endopeptidase MepM/ murein hydrolase activator NlpD